MFFSDQPIPTWWTQYPAMDSLLTGWLGGPAAAKFTFSSDQDIILLSLQSLGELFGTGASPIMELLTHSRVVNWGTDPYAKGSYTYNLPGSQAARKALAEPVAKTLYFAGEATWGGASIGTVEAALQSGIRAASQLVNDR